MVRAGRRLLAEKRLQGIPLSPGIAIGRACFYRRRPPEQQPAAETGPRQEIQRLQASLKWLARQRSVLARQAEAKLGHEHAEIFEAHRLMLVDESFQSQLAGVIEENACSAQHAITTVLNLYKAQFAAADSDYLQQRIDDLNEIQQALLDYLNRVDACRSCGGAVNCTLQKCKLKNDHILVGEEISASLPIETDQHTVGFIVEKGGPNSHAVILARALRCPVVGNVRDLFESVSTGTQVLIDGDRGEVILNPTEETRAYYRDRPAGRAHAVDVSVPVPGLKVMANIGQSGDIDEVLAAGAEGVGLYRTEMEMLVAGRLLSEAEQTRCYSEVLKAVPGRPVCIRLLDLGSDKTAAWLETGPQAGPQTGLRGADLLLARPELLRGQARALVRASAHGPVQVLYPMINSLEQFLELRTLFDQAVADLQPGRLTHGVLFEVPAACLAAPRLMQAADFGCIGTNDLIQYLFAADRGNSDAAVHAGFETDAVLWELLEQLARTAARADKALTICGELAGNPAMTARLMRAGFSTISTSPARISEIRRAAQAQLAPPDRLAPAWP